MARRHVVAKRVVLPDPVYKDQVVTKFMNCMMLNGKKSAAEKAFYGAINIIESKGTQGLGAFK
ncbi:MAG: 30S ribosomal protein S7, partial [Proteobacteria bacterium]|nr:30S ribosomal protein S7 [Pseudomonadota bacterium]